VGFVCVDKPVRWGNTALRGFPALKQVLAALPTCRRPEGGFPQGSNGARLEIAFQTASFPYTEAAGHKSANSQATQAGERALQIALP
jgi:hypothetical protein